MLFGIALCYLEGISWNRKRKVFLFAAAEFLPLIDTAIPLRRGSDWWKNPTKNFSLLLAITSTTETRSFNRPVNRFLRVSVVMQLYPQEVIPVLVVTAIEEVEVVV